MSISFIDVLMPGCDDEFSGASTSVEKTWSTSIPPRIVVDACGGAIKVKRGRSGEVKAVVARNRSCKNMPQAIAEDALKHIKVDLTTGDDTIRIVTRRIDNGASGCGLETTVELCVPDESRLDLQTDVGSIWVVGSPNEVKARNKLGVMLFELNFPRNPAGISDPPPHLKLEGWGGPVEINLASGRYTFTGPVKEIH
jgi:hypothetical protein